MPSYGIAASRLFMLVAAIAMLFATAALAERVGADRGQRATDADRGQPHGRVLRHAATAIVEYRVQLRNTSTKDLRRAV